MNPFLRMRTLIHVVAAISLAASGIALAQPVLAAGALLMVAVAELVCRGAISVPFLESQEDSKLRSIAFPKWLTLTLIGLVLARGIWVAINSTVRIETLCETVSALLVIKLFDRRTVRDDSQILALAVYLCIGAVLVMPRVIPSMLVAINVPVILAAVMTAELASGLVRVPLAGERPIPRKALRGVTIASVIGIFATSVVIFILMPRGPLLDHSRLRSMSSWASGLGGSGRVTGFSDKIQLGRGGLISESRAIVLDVNVEDSSAPANRARTDTLYLRGAALSHYEDGTWRENDISTNGEPIMNRPRDPMTIAPGQTQVIAGTVAASGPSRTIVQRIRMRGSDRVVPLFAVWCPASVEFVTEERITIDRATLTLSRQGPDAPLSYVVTSVVPIDNAATTNDRTPRRPVQTTGIPRRVAAIAAEILQRARIEPDPSKRPPADDVLAMRAMEGYLRREFGYTLDLVAAPSGRDPVEWFLTSEKRGNCEYFASALALMARSVGIESRVMTGYVAAEFSEGTSSYVVRQSNAHAWVEARTAAVPGRIDGGNDDQTSSPLELAAWHGWQTFDPTPPEDFRRLHRPDPNLAGKLGQWLDSVEYFWVANVVAFDDSRQSALLDRRTSNWIEERLRMFMQVDPETGEPRESNAKRIGKIVGAFVGATLLLVGIVGVLRWLGVRLLQRRNDPDRAAALSPSSAELYKTLDRWLTKEGTSESRSLPLAQRVREVISRDSRYGDLEHIADSLNAERFGGQLIPFSRAEELAVLIRELPHSEESENSKSAAGKSD